MAQSKITQGYGLDIHVVLLGDNLDLPLFSGVGWLAGGHH
jgi:hypothetical protein